MRAWLAMRVAAAQGARGTGTDDKWREGRARRAVTAAEREELQLRILRERWVEIDVVKTAWAEEGTRVRDALLALPERLAHCDAQTIREAIEGALEGLACGAVFLEAGAGPEGEA